MSVELDVIGRCPCDSGWISQEFKSIHRAIDIGWLSKYGANLPVMAWYDGIVVTTGTDSAGGVYVVLKHEASKYTIITRYWHFVKGSVVVKKGQTVKQGSKLGTRGNTGISSGIHLHFEIWICPKGYTYKSSDVNKYAVDPMKYTYLFEGQVMKGSPVLLKKPVEKAEPKPVTRDETVHQVEVIAEQLRIRETASLNGEQLFICDKGIYNVIQTQEADGYTWFEIESDRWIATKEGSWTKDLPVVKVPTPEEIINDLRAQIECLKNELASTKTTLVATENSLAAANKVVEEVRKAVS